ncbi:MAG TPA: transketolase C-terminal domain-containing protein [Candidatus Limnocylindria bacterium]|nr:transketolase C-terminal domain-containing protein [Candidatus Limnocylindria bacterium]
MPEIAGPQELRYIQAVNAALRWALETHPEALIFGEDVALPGGPFGATKGLHDAFGGRVFDTPISEAAIIGAALGAGMRGRRPIIEIMYGDFMAVAMDQIVNQVANTRYVSRGTWSAPITIRTQQGYSPGACAQHSQSLEAWYGHIPGLRVGIPASPRDAYEILRSAIASEDPTLVIESRLLYPDTGPVTLGGPVEPIGGARVVRPGSDVTLVSWSRLVTESIRAAEAAAAEGHSVEVIDLRWLSPLDFATVAESVHRTGRLVIAHEANLTGGFGAEIAARAARECFWDLDAPIERIGAPDIPIPAAPSLQAAAIPDATSILGAIGNVLDGPARRDRPASPAGPRLGQDAARSLDA